MVNDEKMKVIIHFGTQALTKALKEEASTRYESYDKATFYVVFDDQAVDSIEHETKDRENLTNGEAINFFLTLDKFEPLEPCAMTIECSTFLS